MRNVEHYMKASTCIQPIDVIRHAPFCLGNCLKYILRAGNKGSAMDDILKAWDYLLWQREMSQRPVRKFFKNYGELLRKFDRLQDVHTIDDLSFVLEDLEDEHDCFDSSLREGISRICSFGECKKTSED